MRLQHLDCWIQDFLSYRNILRKHSLSLITKLLIATNEHQPCGTASSPFWCGRPFQFRAPALLVSAVDRWKVARARHRDSPRQDSLRGSKTRLGFVTSTNGSNAALPNQSLIVRFVVMRHLNIWKRTYRLYS